MLKFPCPYSSLYAVIIVFFLIFPSFHYVYQYEKLEKSVKFDVFLIL